MSIEFCWRSHIWDKKDIAEIEWVIRVFSIRIWNISASHNNSFRWIMDTLMSFHATSELNRQSWCSLRSTCSTRPNPYGKSHHHPSIPRAALWQRLHIRDSSWIMHPHPWSGTPIQWNRASMSKVIQWQDWRVIRIPPILNEHLEPLTHLPRLKTKAEIMQYESIAVTPSYEAIWARRGYNVRQIYGMYVHHIQYNRTTSNLCTRISSICAICMCVVYGSPLGALRRRGDDGQHPWPRRQNSSRIFLQSTQFFPVFTEKLFVVICCM